MREYEALRAACEVTVKEHAGTHARIARIHRKMIDGSKREYEALRAAGEMTVRENRGMVGLVKRALDRVAEMETSAPESERRNASFCPQCGRKE